MLWEGGWEWARLTKSKYISIEVTCPPPPPPPPPYLLLISILLPLPVRTHAIRSVPPPLSFSLSKVGVSFGAVLKKSKKRQAKTLLLKIRSTPIALAALPASFFRSRFLPCVSLVSQNLSFRCGLSLKSRKNVKRKHYF